MGWPCWSGGLMAEPPLEPSSRGLAKPWLPLDLASGVAREVYAFHLCSMGLPGKQQTHQLTVLLLLPGSAQTLPAATSPPPRRKVPRRQLNHTEHLYLSFKRTPSSAKDITFPDYKTHIHSSTEGTKAAAGSKPTQFLQNVLKCFQKLAGDCLSTPRGHRRVLFVFIGFY